MTNDLKTAWEDAKKGMEKSAFKPPSKALSLVTGGGKSLSKAPKALPAAGKETALVERSIAREAPTMRQAKGRVIDAEIVPYTGSAAVDAATKATPTLRSILRGAGEGIGKQWGKLSPGVQGGLKATGLLGAGALAGRADGKAVGKKEGLEQGAEQGFNAGVSAGAQQGSMDPGILGRLLEVFTGRNQAAVGMGDPTIALQRQQTIKRILPGQ